MNSSLGVSPAEPPCARGPEEPRTSLETELLTRSDLSDLGKSFVQGNEAETTRSVGLGVVSRPLVRHPANSWASAAFLSFSCPLSGILLRLVAQNGELLSRGAAQITERVPPNHRRRGPQTPQIDLKIYICYSYAKPYARRQLGSGSPGMLRKSPTLLLTPYAAIHSWHFHMVRSTSVPVCGQCHYMYSVGFFGHSLRAGAHPKVYRLIQNL